MIYASHRSLGTVEISPMHASERALVTDGWVEGLVEAQGHGRRSGSRHRHVYLVAAGREVDAYLRDSDVSVLVARDAECAARAYGWISGAHGAVLWCSVKRDHRREGIARTLFQALTRELGELRHFVTHSRYDALAQRAGLTFRTITEVA